MAVNCSTKFVEKDSFRFNWRKDEGKELSSGEGSGSSVDGQEHGGGQRKNRFFGGPWNKPYHPVPYVIAEEEEKDGTKFMKSYWDEFEATKEPWQRPSDSIFDKAVFFPHGESKADKETWLKYLQQRWESDDFEVHDVPAGCLSVDLVPHYYHYMNFSKVKEEVDMLAKLAISKYNSYNNEKYEFEEVINVTTLSSTNTTYYITFKVKNTKAADGSNLETFQAKAWFGVSKYKVILCRPKPSKRAD